MFVFGHLGIGKKLAAPFSRGLPWVPLFLGMLFPDLLDKAVYYGLSWMTGLQGAALGLISGTRTFGHTVFLLLALAAISWLFRSRWLAALVLGMATHHLLDSLTEYFEMGTNSEALQALLWPLRGWNFPIYPYNNLGEHLSLFRRPFIFGAEILGLAFLGWDYWNLRKKRA